MKPTIRAALLFSAISLVLTAMAPAKPLKVFLLVGQSNMEGQAVVGLAGKDYNDGKGTLAVLMRDPAKAPMFSWSSMRSRCSR